MQVSNAQDAYVAVMHDRYTSAMTWIKYRLVGCSGLHCVVKIFSKDRRPFSAGSTLGLAILRRSCLAARADSQSGLPAI